ncbi:hypothetical protein [Selenomonas sp.]|uniref:hypothetical protein n=1 Tax=Selenomonas sp. TaxID=2053611 RepID=UPI002A831832|nr:hypothetical protein [Selenomonas sp.]MDY4415445.1 hypothetical protein [Selenomonas sp.]
MFQHQQKRFFPLLAATWFALAGATAASFAFLPQTAEARVKSEAESRWGQELVEEYDEKYGVEQQADGTPLKRMQDRLVAFNSDKLNYYDGVHEYWIEPVYLAKRYLPGISGIQKGNCIVLSPDDFSDALKDKHYWFVENSNDATTMAHELAHYINHDSESSKLSQSEKEFRADELAMDLMANVPEYSFGSMALRHRGEDVDEDGHPTDTQRMKMVLDKIKKDSKGRVRVDEDGRMYYKGELFGDDGYLKTGWFGDYQSDTLYLAAQIATAIKKGWWKRNLLAHGPESNVFVDGRDGCTILAIYTDTTYTVPRKILARFSFDDRLDYDQFESDVERHDAERMDELMDLAK